MVLKMGGIKGTETVRRVTLSDVFASTGVRPSPGSPLSTLCLSLNPLLFFAWVVFIVGVV